MVYPGPDAGAALKPILDPIDKMIERGVDGALVYVEDETEPSARKLSEVN